MANKIKVHEKALAHLSRGLYRSPASALRELVSNAWDANATAVRVDTNFPNFFQISIEDNGEGFTKGEFRKLMEGGIGNSIKRPVHKYLFNDRPVIGRLGIGMLGISQICGAFSIISKPRKGEGFRARIHLYDLLKKRLDENEEDVVGTEEVDVGEYDFEEFDPADVRYGTIIIADDVHPTFVLSFQKSLKFECYKEPTLEWKKNLKIISGVRSLQELGDYWRLLWELSAACPVPYLDENALPNHLIAEEQKKLESFNFKVIVDNIELKKPVYLRGNPDGYTTKKIETQRKKVYGKDLAFHGYVVVQEGTQLRPDELRGIMVRIKNVGIGYYDLSMLDYRINEGPRSRWLTGEIVADEGLEDAINIDRDSFNRFHPEFRAIQEYVHEILQTEIFPKVYKQIDVRSNAKTRSKEEKRTKDLKTVISKVINIPVVIKPKVEKIEPKEMPTVTIKETGTKMEVRLPDTESLKAKKPFRQLAAAILAVFEIAMLENTDLKRKEVFTKILMELLAKW